MSYFTQTLYPKDVDGHHDVGGLGMLQSGRGWRDDGHGLRGEDVGGEQQLAEH
jgi:hypothetical protein